MKQKSGVITLIEIKSLLGSVQKKITVTSGQLEYEFGHLLGKLKDRDPRRYARLKEVSEISAHPIFNETAGNIEDWEIINSTK